MMLGFPAGLGASAAWRAANGASSIVAIKAGACFIIIILGRGIFYFNLPMNLIGQIEVI